MNNNNVKYTDLSIGQRVWFNSNDDDFPVYVPIIIDEIFPPKSDKDGYIYGTVDDGSEDKYKLYLNEIIVEEPNEEFQRAMENDLDNNSDMLHITKKQFNELLKEAIKEHLFIGTNTTISASGFFDTYTDVFFDDELIAHYRQ